MRNPRGTWALALGAITVATGCQTEVLDVISSFEAGTPGVEAGTPGVDAGNGVEPAVQSRPSPDAGAEASSATDVFKFFLPPRCERAPKPVPASCTKQIGETCTSTLECCVGACWPGDKNGALRCKKSPACALECETCASDNDCCGGQCNGHNGDTKRCELNY